MMTPTDDPNVSSTETEPESTATIAEEQGEQEDVSVGHWQRISAVLFSPVEAMRGVKLNGGWVAPLVVFLVCTILYVAMAGALLGEAQADQARDQMQERVASGQMSQEEADRAIELTSGFQEGIGGKMVMILGTVITIFIATLITTVFLFLVSNIIHNGTESFGKYWSMAWYIGVIGSVNLVLMGLLIMLTQDAQGGHLGLAILTKSDPKSALHVAASMVSVFSIWEAIVAGIGISIFGKIGRGLGMVWGALIFIIVPAAMAYGLTNLFSGIGG
jgi:Yip1 domain